MDESPSNITIGGYTPETNSHQVSIGVFNPSQRERMQNREKQLYWEIDFTASYEPLPEADGYELKFEPPLEEYFTPEAAGAIKMFCDLAIKHGATLHYNDDSENHNQVAVFV